MKVLLIGTLLLTGVNVAHANDQLDPLVKCLIAGEKQGVSDRNCPAFEKALDCQAKLLQFYEGQLDSSRRRLSQIKDESSSARNTKRRQLLARAVHEEELAVANIENSVAKSKEGDSILRREKHEAGCN